ncbi:MAG: autotransporter assembly complex protein TamA, partial [Paracoccaceae bacterium]
LRALYAQGYYGGVIRIRLDGIEAAELPLLQLPGQIKKVDIRVIPGPKFRFGRAEMAPLAPQDPASDDGSTTGLPEGFATDKPAPSTVIRGAVRAAVSDWRDAGHAKAAPVAQSIRADHARARLDASVTLAPGPRVTFGALVQDDASAVRSERIARIAGLPSGEVFSPATLDEVATRLRRTGAFASVALREADRLGRADSGDASMDITLSLVDAPPRRFGLGAEVSAPDGVTLSGFWLHRNMFGGAERLRVDGRIAQIGGTAGTDYSLAVRLDRPAVLGPASNGYLTAGLDRLNEPGFATDTAELGAGVTFFRSDTHEIALGMGVRQSRTIENGTTVQRDSLLTFPVALTRDLRDDVLAPRDGSFVAVTTTPFAGLGDSASGARTTLDARRYMAMPSILSGILSGAPSQATLAGRVQVGSLWGAEADTVVPDFLFYSGGTGTVRGQPYQSLGLGATGGRSFLGLSAEARFPVRGDLGIVAFADAGYIGSDPLFEGTGDWHSGAGLGLRYDTGVGPIRLDLAVPVGGDTGDGLQIYIG